MCRQPLGFTNILISHLSTLVPFFIMARVGPAAYKIDLPPNAHIHHTFHVSLLKKATGAPKQVIPIPDGSTTILQPFRNLDRKLGKSGHKGVVKFLVQWKDLPIYLYIMQVGNQLKNL